MVFFLGPDAAAAGYRLAQFDTLASTNTEGLSRASAGERGPLWLVTDSQIGGHGRRGRPWIGSPGNLAATLLLASPVAGETVAQLGFVAGLALHRALAKIAPSLGGRLALKWPNDLLADGKKLAGILVETDDPRQGGAVVIGFGVNVRAAPADLPYAAASLRDLGVSLDAETLFRALSDSWVGAFDLWAGGAGMPVVRERWLERAAGLGGALSVALGAETIAGRFSTIDESGRLVIETERGDRKISAGEVFFGSAATLRAG